MKKLRVVVLSTACWAVASSAMAFDNPLSPPPGAPVAALQGSHLAAAPSTGLIEQVSPSMLSGRPVFISLQRIDTTAPPGTNPFAGRNYDGILVPIGNCGNASTCSGGQTLCTGTCVDLTADPNNCGACGTVCGLGTTCQSGTCAVPPAFCTLDSQCGTGAYCDTGTNTCAAQGATGFVCASNNQCQSGLTCQAGFCAPVTCMSDGDCGTGFYCDTGMGSCVSQQGAGVVCTSADQCLSGTCGGVVQFAERFVGQSLGFAGDFDVLSGTPLNALALQVGVPDQNLDALMDVSGTVLLAGVGPVGYSPALPLVTPDYDGIGEGAVAALLASGYSEVAFDAAGVDGGGSLTIDFFRRDGSRIDSLNVSTGPPLPGPITLNLAFQRTEKVNDIAGFSIYNTDPGGVGYANFRLGAAFNMPAPVVSPRSLALLSAVLGLVGLVGLWRARVAGR